MPPSKFALFLQVRQAEIFQHFRARRSSNAEEEVEEVTSVGRSDSGDSLDNWVQLDTVEDYKEKDRFVQERFNLRLSLPSSKLHTWGVEDLLHINLVDPSEDK